MRKVALLLSVVAAALMLASGVAIAKNFQGDGKNNRLVGTSKKDTIAGSGGDDNIFGKGGQDRLYGDSGADKVSGGTDPDDIFGGKGADNLFGNGDDDYANAADNRGGDFIDCGPGFDSLVYDAIDFSEGPPEAVDEFVNCEDVTAVIVNPDTGTDSESLSRMDREEVEQAIDEGILLEVE